MVTSLLALPRVRWATLVAGLAGIGLLAAAQAMGIDPSRALVLLVIAPLTEEVIFRAGLQEGLLRRGVSAPIAGAATALVFAITHAVARADIGTLAVAGPAWCIGQIYGRTRRLRHAVALHALMNALWLAGGVMAR